MFSPPILHKNDELPGAENAAPDGVHECLMEHKTCNNLLGTPRLLIHLHGLPKTKRLPDCLRQPFRDGASHAPEMAAQGHLHFVDYDNEVFSDHPLPEELHEPVSELPDHVEPLDQVGPEVVPFN
jgi:hypothetical protein